MTEPQISGAEDDKDIKTKDLSTVDSISLTPPITVTKSISDTDPTKSESNHLATLSAPRKLLLLIIFCLSFFLDTCNDSFFLAALPQISEQVSLTNSESVWIFSAYELTFAALLLVCGRLSDLYDSKWIFITGSSLMSLFSLLGGLIPHKIPLIVFRALTGAGGALTIPSAMHVIIHMYPDPTHQARAISVFGALGTLGVSLGLLIGAAISSYAPWQWIFYIGAIIAGITSLLCIVFAPPTRPRNRNVRLSPKEKKEKMKRLDPIGVFLFAAALILFTFAITEGSGVGWGSAEVIASLVISVFVLVGFFVWEARIPEDVAALPPRIWSYPHFTILIIISFMPFMWWAALYPLFAWYWETVFDWSPIKVAIHFLPLSLGILPIMPLIPFLQRKFGLRNVILLGLSLIFIGTIPLPFGSGEDPSKYWRFLFVGYLIGTVGATIVYLTISIAILRTVPPGTAGVTQALLSSVSQTASSAGIAVITSIQTSVQIRHGGALGFEGRKAGLWFLAALVGVVGVGVAVGMRELKERVVEEESQGEEGKRSEP